MSKPQSILLRALALMLLLWGLSSHPDLWAGAEADIAPQASQPNVIFILSDDHRYDAMGFTGRFAGLQTPALDEMARSGRHFANTFVSTSLCSPSRATILTGQYAHEHRVVDNTSPADPKLKFFPSELQKAGYRTAFIGKWHMGNHGDDSPRPGFDHWVSFKGQGTYFAPNLNVNGQRQLHADTTYTTDLLTRMAREWAAERSDKPYFLYLSHKAVHAEFEAALRHLGSYAALPISYPATMWPPTPELLALTRAINPGEEDTCPPDTPARFAAAQAVGYDYSMLPNWVKAQRHSWHGVDHMYNGQITFDSFYVAYLETLRALDNSVGEMLAFAKTENAAGRPTIVVYMGDNGFSFGEHGLIDKRQAYEESMRVPLLAWGPGVVKPGVSEELVHSTDIASTMVALAGGEIPAHYRGNSLAPLLVGQSPNTWRSTVPYEYYWEQAFPQTPTVHAIRGDRYKFIRYHGIWDTNEFYDLEEDPAEARNLIAEPSLQDTIGHYNRELWNWLGSTDGEAMPIKATPHRRPGVDYRYGDTY